MPVTMSAFVERRVVGNDVVDSVMVSFALWNVVYVVSSHWSLVTGLEFSDFFLKVLAGARACVMCRVVTLVLGGV